MSAAAVPRPALDAPPARLSASERLELLCDAGSLQPIRSRVASPRLNGRARAGDGVIGATGEVDGRPVACYAQDSSFMGGSLGEAQADTIVRTMELAGRARMPVVGFVDSGGARVQEGVAALGGYGRIFHANVALSGVVPQLSIVSGTAAGGGSYSPALTDFVLMTEGSSMFLTGPQIVRDAVGEDVDAQALGGPRVHARNGVAHFVAPSDVESIFLARELLGYLPQAAGESPPRARPGEPADVDPGALVPAAARSVYDVRRVIRALADDGALLEVAERWARNVVTAFCRVDGRPAGVIANQPRHLGGTLDADSAAKAARFVRTCDRFGLPLVVLVDTPGFLPGTRQEGAGVIRHGAKLLHAFAAATVPKLTVVLRKAYGGAYITMNSKDLGADLALAWPGAEIGVMGAPQAVGLVHRRELAAAHANGGGPGGAAAERSRLEAEYAAGHLRAEVAAREGFVDEVIEPAHTRDRLARALRAFGGRIEEPRRDGNIPL